MPTPTTRSNLTFDHQPTNCTYPNQNTFPTTGTSITRTSSISKALVDNARLMFLLLRKNRGSPPHHNTTCRSVRNQWRSARIAVMQCFFGEAYFSHLLPKDYLPSDLQDAFPDVWLACLVTAVSHRQVSYCEARNSWARVLEIEFFCFW